MSAFLAKEFRAFGRSGVPGVSISLPGDSMSVWRFEVSADAFDASLPQMKTLRADLERLAQATGHPDAIIMEARFVPAPPNMSAHFPPTDAPPSPPLFSAFLVIFLRVRSSSALSHPA